MRVVISNRWPPFYLRDLLNPQKSHFPQKIWRQTPLCPCKVCSYSQEIFLFSLAKIFSSSTHSHIIETYVSLSSWLLSSDFSLLSHHPHRNPTNPALIECPSPNWIQYFRYGQKELRKEWYYLLFLTLYCLTNITLAAMLHHQVIKNIVNKDSHRIWNWGVTFPPCLSSIKFWKTR